MLIAYIHIQKEIRGMNVMKHKRLTVWASCVLGGVVLAVAGYWTVAQIQNWSPVKEQVTASAPASPQRSEAEPEQQQSRSGRLTAVPVSNGFHSFNQKSVDVTGDGWTWVLLRTDGRLHLRGIDPETNEGTDAAALMPDAAGGSMYIDQDDALHIVYETEKRHIHYVRGEYGGPEGGWTLGAPVAVDESGGCRAPDVVAHRMDGGGWAVHIVYSREAGDGEAAVYRQLEIAADGTASLAPLAETVLGPASAGAPAWPSIDYHHTPASLERGKAVKEGSPHLYTAWNTGRSGEERGIRYRRALYEAGGWRWKAEEPVDETYYAGVNEGAPDGNWFLSVYDGSRSVVFGRLGNAAGQPYLLAYTMTEQGRRLDLFESAPAGTGLNGSGSYDAQGNLYFAGHTGENGPVTAVKWKRSAKGLTEPQQLAPAGKDVQIALNRGDAYGQIRAAAYVPEAANRLQHSLLTDTIERWDGSSVPERGDNLLSAAWETYADPESGGSVEIRESPAAAAGGSLHLKAEGLAAAKSVMAYQTVRLEDHSAHRYFNINGEWQALQLTKAAAELSVEFLDAGLHVLSAHQRQTGVPASEFETVHKRGRIPAAAVYAKVYVKINGTEEGGEGELTAANLRFEYGSGNLLDNPEFQSGAEGSLPGWQSFAPAGAVFTHSPADGGGTKNGNGAELKAELLGEGEYAFVHQTFGVGAGEAYEAGVVYRTIGSAGAEAVLALQFLDEDGRKLEWREHTGTGASANGGASGALKLEGRAPSDAVYVKYMIGLKGVPGGAGGTVRFEEARLFPK